ncbi:MAG: hypothetical protein Q4F35_01965 [Akkermansia sp.]|nr:hypothetical protein [Akkermansia sp.]
MFRKKVLTALFTAAVALTLNACGSGGGGDDVQYADDNIVKRSEEYGFALLEGHFHSVTLLGSETDYIKSLQINRDGGYVLTVINLEYDPEKNEELKEGETQKTHYESRGMPWLYKNVSKNVSTLELRKMVSETKQHIVDHLLTITWLSETQLQVHTFYKHENKEYNRYQTMTLIETPETAPLTSSIE